MLSVFALVSEKIQALSVKLFNKSFESWLHSSVHNGIMISTIGRVAALAAQSAYRYLQTDTRGSKSCFDTVAVSRTVM